MEIKTGDIFMKDKNRGFTLIELLITLAIASIVMAAVWKSFQSQQESYVVQEQVSAMQQNLRGGLDIMVKELRMAGLDATGNALAGFVVATNNEVRFTTDLNQDGDVSDTNEDIRYALYISSATVTNKQNLGRDTGANLRAVAEDIEAIEFLYTVNNGTPTTPIITQTLTPLNLETIRSIDISILARTGRGAKDFINTDTYSPATVLYGIAAAAVWGPYNDSFRRRLLITSVQCRNMGVIN